MVSLDETMTADINNESTNMLLLEVIVGKKLIIIF
jgi:hypothetical protein